MFVIQPEAVPTFILPLPIEELFGVGKVTAQKLHRKTCADLQRLSLLYLTQHFGKLGQHLYNQSRGIDERRVIWNIQPKTAMRFKKSHNAPAKRVA